MMREATPPSMDNEKGLMRELARIVLLFWRKKKWIMGGTLVFLFLGGTYAFLASPVYISTAIIVPKEVSSSRSMQLSMMSGLGGVNPFTGGGILGRTSLMLQGESLALLVYEKDSTFLQRLFPKAWDEDAQRWKKRPTDFQATRRLRSSLMTEVNARNMTITLRVGSRDSTLSKDLAEAYLEALNDRLKGDIVRDAEASRIFLEEQLTRTIDPFLQQKIQTLIGEQIENAMLVSSSTFSVLESPDMPHFRDKPRRRLILQVSLVLGVLMSMSFILAAQGASRLRRAILNVSRES